MVLQDSKVQLDSRDLKDSKEVQVFKVQLDSRDLLVSRDLLDSRDQLVMLVSRDL